MMCMCNIVVYDSILYTLCTTNCMFMYFLLQYYIYIFLYTYYMHTGTQAKLEPPEGGTVADGLEVKVAFNGVWKDSLTELSGGQRSLLALSLILGLLLFKPAPMYVYHMSILYLHI